VRAERRDWQRSRQPAIRRQPGRVVFIDETSIKTNMTPLRGRALRGERLPAQVPFGKWHTQTFIAGLRCDGLVAPWVIDGALNGEAFDTYVQSQLAPTLEPGDVVILDNLTVHKSPRAAKALADRGAWFLFLPRYSPDFNPIEQAFAKLKTLLRKAAARTYNQLWRAVGHICDLFTQEECRNFFKAANCIAD
jgi:transposase